jgi:hypothetical protein
MTNYDIDEIILPRLHTTKHHVEIYNANRKTSPNLNAPCLWPFNAEKEKHTSLAQKSQIIHHTSMYELATKLTKAHGSNIAHFHFPHYLMLSDHKQFFQLLQTAIQDFKIGRNNTFLYFNARSNTRLKFEINGAEDLEYARSLVPAIEFAKCVNTTFLQRNETKRTVETGWTRSLAVYFNNRFGKSIYNTNNVFSINQHVSTFMKPGTGGVELSDEFGFCSHFREADIGLEKDQVLTVMIKDVRVDVEYLTFLDNFLSS